MVRHGERVDQVFGKSWLQQCSTPDGRCSPGRGQTRDSGLLQPEPPGPQAASLSTQRLGAGDTHSLSPRPCCYPCALEGVAPVRILRQTLWGR